MCRSDEEVLTCHVYKDGSLTGPPGISAWYVFTEQYLYCNLFLAYCLFLIMVTITMWV